MPPGDFTCSDSRCDCGKSFPSQKALSGHLGGGTKIIGSYTAVLKHGERRAYQKHIRLGDEPCVLCSRANAQYMRDHRAKGRLAARKGKK